MEAAINIFRDFFNRTVHQTPQILCCRLQVRASNVTGIVSDTLGLSRLLHSHGALAFWDFAAAGPYVEIAMNPTASERAYKDAIFLSPHKFIGGPGTPGVLVAKKALFRNRVPSMPGGGTVAMV